MQVTITTTLLLSALTLAVALPLQGIDHRLFGRDVASAFPDPYQDAFYKAPSNLASYSVGDIIRTRAVATTILASVGSSFQLLYRTTDTSKNAEATVATIWKPTTPRVPAQILSYHPYMDSDSLDCNPSWAFVQGSGSENTGTTSTDATVYIEWALSNGIYVVSPDDEGPKAAFIAGFQQGMSALDGIRAITNHYKLPKNTEVALLGYSGGASVTAWTANLAGSYAPDINVIGAVHGGTPIDVKGIVDFLNGGATAGFAGAGLVGLMNAYPDLNTYVLAHLDPTATAIFEEFRGGNYCIQDVALGHPLTDFFKLINVDNFEEQPIPKAVFAKESLLMNVSSVGVAVPKFPRMIWHALEDEVVPFNNEQQFVDQQCAHGANIQFQIFPVAEHISAMFLGVPGAIIFLQQLYAGTTPAVKCGSPSTDFVSLTDPQAATVMGQAAVDKLMKLGGTSFIGEIIHL